MSNVLASVGVRENKLLSSECYSFMEELDNLKSYLVGEYYSTDAGMSIPRFGLLSIFARSIPFFAYDHPALTSRVDTAFTDGRNIFISVNFMEKILSDDEAGRNGMLFLVFHELGHILFRHLYRLHNFPHSISNGATDTSMNTRYLLDFVVNPISSKNILYPLPEALTVGWGFNEGDIEKYAHRSEEDIAREYMKEFEEQNESLEDFIKNLLQGGGGGVGSKKKNGQGDQNEDGQGKLGQGDQEPDGMGDNHIMHPEDLAKILKEAGLGHVIGLLDMPVDENGNLDEGKMQKQSDIQLSNIQNAHTQTNALKQILGNRMPGAHSHDYVGEMLGKLAKPKITWKQAVKQNIIGSGMKQKNTMDVPGDAYFIDPTNMNMPNRLYLGARVPAKPSGFALALLDTSGSMHGEWMHESASEIFGMVASNKYSCPELIFMQIDTVIRGEPTILNERTAKKYLTEAFEARGRGGTSLTTGIIMAMEHPEVKKRLKMGQKLTSLTYFTDLGDIPPKREDLPDNLPKNVLYLASPGTYNDEFAKNVSDYAKVVSMGEKITIDMNHEGIRVTGKSKAMRP